MSNQVVATAGHVDHGKSTLVRALTGMEPDRWAEERRRGLTIGLGFAWTELPGGRTLAFVDVPGHERFVGTMLAGVGPVPAVLFVVAADGGWMPQSTEHLDALAALRTEHGLLVITRADLADPEPARAEARARLAPTSLAGIPSVAVSATTGAGMPELRAQLTALVDRLPHPDPEADVRLWVDRSFTVRGAGTVVTGTLGGGTLRIGDELEIGPDGGRAVVRGLRSMGGELTRARGVARVGVNLRGIARESAGRGNALLTPGRWLTTTEIDARLDAPAPAQELTLHIGSAAVPARVRPLGPVNTDTHTARLRLRTALPLRIGDRALLRDPGGHRVVAGLTVMDVRPPPLRRRGAAARRAVELAAYPDTPDAAGEVARRGLVRRADLAAMGTDPSTLTTASAVTAGEWLLDPALAKRLATRLGAAVAAHDAAHPLEPGLPLGAAAQELQLPDLRLVEALLAAEPSAGLRSRDGRVRRADEPDRLLKPLVSALRTLRAELTEQPFRAPERQRLAELGLGDKELAALVRAGELARIGPGIYLLPDAEDRALELLAEFGDDEFTLSAARRALDTTRRVAVPLLELLGRRGRTERTATGNHRLRAR